jgi:hypothetical protein
MVGRGRASSVRAIRVDVAQALLPAGSRLISTLFFLADSLSDRQTRQLRRVHRVLHVPAEVDEPARTVAR